MFLPKTLHDNYHVTYTTSANIPSSPPVLPSQVYPGCYIYLGRKEGTWSGRRSQLAEPVGAREALERGHRVHSHICPSRRNGGGASGWGGVTGGENSIKYISSLVRNSYPWKPKRFPFHLHLNFFLHSLGVLSSKRPKSVTYGWFS